MTKRGLLARLGAAAKNADTEGAHGDADKALLDYIDDAEVRTAYAAVDKWYA